MKRSPSLKPTVLVRPATRALRRWASQPGGPPLLLSATQQSVLETTAHELAQAILCERNTSATNTSACTACRACRLVTRGNHPDLSKLTTTQAAGKIKDIRQLLTDTALTPTSSRRVIIIHTVEKVSLPAANALLKSLEEPRPTTSFILTTRWPRRLLPTILSRVTHVRLPATAPPGTAGASALLEAAMVVAGEINDEILDTITAALEQQLRRQGPTPSLKRAYARLRDYYFIAARQGNTKLAGEVLLLSVAVSDGMS